MSEVTVFNEIIAHQLEGIMFHDDSADMYDFLGLRGYKREQEYRALCEFAEMRSTSRYVINHINHLPNIDGLVKEKEIDTGMWRRSNSTRFNVSESERKSKVKELFTLWLAWERETKTFYQKKFQELIAIGQIAYANKVNRLIGDVDCELKRLERQYLDLSAVGWDMVYIAEKQDEIHDYYEKLTEEHIKIEIN